MKRYLVDPDMSDDELSSMASEHMGYPVRIASYTGTFVLRKVHVEWTVTGESVLEEDVRVCTWHVIKAPGGVPSADWLTSDYEYVRDEFLAWWNLIKKHYGTNMSLTNIKFYDVGPAIERSGPPEREYIQNVPGTSTGFLLPPQVALSVTERAGAKKNWGRFYLPAMATVDASGGAHLQASGRPYEPMLNDVATSTDLLYEHLGTNGVPIVIYHPHLAANRPIKDKPVSDLPERPAEAVVVDTLQIDDVWDVIRRRRYEQVMVRVLRGVMSPDPPAAAAKPAASLEDVEDPSSAQTP
jgi:hypothetical protein